MLAPEATERRLASPEGFLPQGWKRASVLLWCSIMRSWPATVYVGSSGELVSRAGRGGSCQHTSTRASPYARSATLIQASFLLLRFGGWCPLGGTPNVAKALSMVSSLNPASCKAWMQ